MADASSWRSLLRTLAKYGIALGALAWVLYATNISRAVDTISQLSVTTLVLVMVVSVAGVLARVTMWYVLVTYFGETDLKRLVTADLIIKFVNSLFPSRLSGRSIAPIALRHFTGLAWNRAVAVTVAHTGLYAVLYGLLTLVGLAADIDAYGPGLTVVVLLSVGAYLTVGGAVVLAGWRLDVFDRLVAWIARLADSLPTGGTVATALDRFRVKLLDGSDEQFRLLVRDPRTVALFVVTWITALMLVPAVRIWILLAATGVTELDPLLLPLYIIVAYSVTVLPLTPGGIGVAEATAVAVFVALGVPEGAIVSVVFLDRVFGVYLPSLAGWIPLVQTDFRSVID